MNKSEEDERSKREALCQKAVDDVSEHFDSVRIFVTYHGIDGTPGTKSFSCGRGNYYAVLGQVKDWIVRQDEETRKTVESRDVE